MFSQLKMCQSFETEREQVHIFLMLSIFQLDCVFNYNISSLILFAHHTTLDTHASALLSIYTYTERDNRPSRVNMSEHLFF